MKKRLLSTMMLFVLILGLGVPVSAYNTNSVYRDVELKAMDELTDMPISIKEKSSASAELPEAVAYARNPDIYINSISAYPWILIYDENGNPEGYVDVPEVTVGVRFNIATQINSMSITSTQLSNIKGRIATLLSSTSLSGKRFQIFAWTLTTSFTYNADRPKYVTLTPTSTCTAGTAPLKFDLTSTSGVVENSFTFYVPDGKDNSNYFVGAQGGFYFTNSSGQLSGAMISTGLTVNSDK